MSEDLKLNPKLKLQGLSKTLKKEASKELWIRGDIRSFLLDPTQQEMATEFDRSKELRHVIMCSRRLGKSWLLVVLAIEAALKKKNQQIKYITDTQRAARDIVQPLFREILSTCPPDCKPEFKVHANKWEFPNGSEIALYGVDSAGGNDLRGQAADLFLIDEAGFIDKLSILVTEILMPMIIQRDGRGILSSTPPKGMDHPFVGFVAQAQKNRALTKRTIYDCPRFTQKMLRTFEEEAGGKDSDVFRREYLCEMIMDSSTSVIPEFTDAVAKAVTFSELPPLTFYPDNYVALDAGFVDNTAILFGYWDFPSSSLVILREYVAKGNNTEEIADNIKSVERSLWGDAKPFKRVSDTDLRLIQDLKVLHGLKFIKTEKDNKEAQVNAVRILISQGRIKIHESCVNLLMQLRYGSWKTSSTGRRDFARTPALGHNDCLDALIYMVRSINMGRNPMPSPNVDRFAYDYSPQKANLTSNAKVLSKIFN